MFQGPALIFTVALFFNQLMKHCDQTMNIKTTEVTVCPPKGSNTVLNQTFKKITDE